MLKEYSDVFMVIHLDDIVVYNKTLKEYIIHVSKILQILNNVYLKIKLLKTKFYV